jgi:uncharacterized protein (DUF302 family)
MSEQRRKRGTIPLALSAAILAAAACVSQSGLGSEGEKSMNTVRFAVDHVQVTTDKPFEDARKALEAQLGRFDPDVYKSLAAEKDLEKVKARIEAMSGPSGFMLFSVNDHGALLRLAGQKKKAMQYVVGNPLIAYQMTQHDLRASLYAPLRVLIYENERGQTCLEYDKPSSLFGWLGNEQIAPTGALLDRKMEKLVSAAIQ